MKSKLYEVLTLCLLLLLVGCAGNGGVVRFHSMPEGAILFGDGKRYGQTPLTIPYDITEEEKQQGFFVVNDIKVRWSSGAELRIDTIKFPATPGGSQTYTFERPSVDGLDKDVEYELRLKELEFQERLRTEEIELQRSELKEKKKSTKILKEHDSKTESEFRSLRRKMDRLEIDRQNERLRNQRPRLLPIPSL